MRLGLIILLALLLTACGSSPSNMSSGQGAYSEGDRRYGGQTRLPDRIAFYQKDKRWAEEKLGRTNDTLASDGCLVTAAAMALANLGFQTNPADLNKRLTHTDSFTSRGWLIWDGIRRVTAGKATARFYKSVDIEKIDQCMADGYYPLVQFYLPNGRSHWAMILDRSDKGFHMRDPLRRANQPLIFPHSVEKFRALRCVGLA